MSNILKDKNILITGAAKNLGGLTAEVLANEGANIAIHYNSDSSTSNAEELAKKLNNLGVKANTYQADLTTADSVKNLFDSVEKDFGKIYGTVNTVGKVLKKPIIEITEKEYDEMLAVNAKSAFFFIQESGKRIEDGGKIITILTSLLAAFTGHYSVYAGGKSPVEHFSRAAAKEFAPKMISVNNIAPGPMDTPFFYGQEEKDAIAFHKSQALGNRLTKIEDIVPIIKFLLTDGAWITGQTIFANGGYTTR